MSSLSALLELVKEQGFYKHICRSASFEKDLAKLKNGQCIKFSPGLVGDGSESWRTHFCIRFYRLKQVCQFSFCFVIYNNAFQFTVVFSVLSSIGIFCFSGALKVNEGPSCAAGLQWVGFTIALELMSLGRKLISKGFHNLFFTMYPPTEHYTWNVWL